MSLHYSLLDEPLIRARSVADSRMDRYTLPSLLAALVSDSIRDFPALRPHQRHPWHALLVHLAALALDRNGSLTLWPSEAEWRSALLALTPDHPDGTAWCLVAPHDQPAFLQAPTPEGDVASWKNSYTAPDELDMLITSRNHEVKVRRMHRGQPDDWLFALTSLQTQEGFNGQKNYGISRMNSGAGSRPAVGIKPVGHWGKRWQRDVLQLLHSRRQIATELGLAEQGGIALVWLTLWDGRGSLSFSSLDPFYIEICRRIRLTADTSQTPLSAIGTGSDSARIDAAARKGVTGDAWTPVNKVEAKALTIGGSGFHYQLACELLFGDKYQVPIAQKINEKDGQQGLVVVAQGIARGQSKTEGYHERHIPLSPVIRRAFQLKQTDRIAVIASERVQAIGTMRRTILWTALFTLLQGGAEKINYDLASTKQQAESFLQYFETHEDARFFQDLFLEVEAEDPTPVRLQWLIGLAERAELVLQYAFRAGPQSGEKRYRARAAALSRFHGGLRSEKNLPTLAEYFRHLTIKKEIVHATE